jgi:hypothetical protein
MIKGKMRPPRYALEPLATVRKQKVDDAVRALAAAVTGREGAERDRLSAETRRVAHEADAARIRAVERDALERGELRAGDLASADGWELRVATERAGLVAAVQQTCAAEAEACRTEHQAQEEVAARRADADLVEKDRARWSAGRRKHLEAREEEDAAEAYRPVRG